MENKITLTPYQGSNNKKCLYDVVKKNFFVKFKW